MDMTSIVLGGGVICIVGVIVMVVGGEKYVPVMVYIGIVLAVVGLIIFLLPIAAPSVAQSLFRIFFPE